MEGVYEFEECLGGPRTSHRCPFNCKRTSKPRESGKGWVNIAPTFSLSKEKQGNVPLQGPPIMTECHWVGDRLLFITPSPNSSLSHYSWRVIEKFSPNSPTLQPNSIHGSSSVHLINIVGFPRQWQMLNLSLSEGVWGSGGGFLGGVADWQMMHVTKRKMLLFRQNFPQFFSPLPSLIMIELM